MGKCLRDWFAILPLIFLTACATAPRVPEVVNLPQQLPQTPLAVSGRPVVALVLGGGAARGFAHVGVIRALEENNIPVDMVVGTSAGSVVGALYAAGIHGADLIQAAEQLDLGQLTDWIFPDRGVLKGERLQHYVNQLVHNRPIESLPVRYVAVVANLNNGELVAFNHGNVGMAIRASSAIPGLIQPVTIAGNDYADGGVLSQVPVRVARELGADVVIAVDVSRNLLSAEELNSTLAVMYQAMLMMSHRLTEDEVHGADILIRPAVGDIGGSDFELRDQALAAGMIAAQTMMTAIRQAIDQNRAH